MEQVIGKHDLGTDKPLIAIIEQTTFETKSVKRAKPIVFEESNYVRVNKLSSSLTNCPISPNLTKNIATTQL